MADPFLYKGGSGVGIAALNQLVVPLAVKVNCATATMLEDVTTAARCSARNEFRHLASSSAKCPSDDSDSCIRNSDDQLVGGYGS